MNKRKEINNANGNKRNQHCPRREFRVCLPKIILWLSPCEIVISTAFLNPAVNRVESQPLPPYTVPVLVLMSLAAASKVASFNILLFFFSVPMFVHECAMVTISVWGPHIRWLSAPTVPSQPGLPVTSSCWWHFSILPQGHLIYWALYDRARKAREEKAEIWKVGQ